MLDDTQLRLFVFIGVLAIMLFIERLRPKRHRTQARAQRWVTNLSLVVVNSIILKLIGPISAVVVANYTLSHHWGLMALSPIPLPLWAEILIAIVVLDLAIYLQHVAFHRIPILWRLHKVHHVDRDIDATTGIRFHPIEAVISMIYKCCVILALGPIPIAVIIFEIVLNASAMFNHGNVHLPKALDKVLRTFIVTPDFHRVHHSVIRQETDSNYGFFLSIWDRLGKTYIAQPRHHHNEMTIGLESYQTNQPSQLFWCLTLPFKPIKKESSP